jgi:predicted transcriptional regulator
MDKPISSIMEKQVITVDLNDTVENVEKLMHSNRLTCVPVIDSDIKCFGVISAPDLSHFYALRENPKAKRAWEVCTHKIIEVSPDISIREAVELMMENKIHHLVVSQDKTIVGIVSSLNVIQEYLIEIEC